MGTRDSSESKSTQPPNPPDHMREVSQRELDLIAEGDTVPGEDVIHWLMTGEGDPWRPNER
jgi:hypothetical protein